MGVWILAKGFYCKLAVNNLKRNKKRYIPYFIAATIMISVYFMVVTIMYSPGLSNIPSGKSTLIVMFKIGHFIMTIFVIIFMLYINSFLIKQRKKEFGLYGILGLEKLHVARVLLCENLLINGAAFLLGVITACVFGQLTFLLLVKSLRVTGNIYYSIPMESFSITFLLFFGIFVIISIMNIWQVRVANPIDLLKSDHQGEKKVRFIIPTTCLGLVALGWAYYSALTVNNPISALTKFMIAVVLVIFATYALFTSGSIFLLRALKRNKKFYYKTNNFISIAGMIHRMKQNASGLASICILSTMVLVTVSTCVALFLGQEDTLKCRNADDIVIQVNKDTSEEEYRKLHEIFEQTSKNNKVEIENEYRYFSITDMLFFKEGKFVAPNYEATYEEMIPYAVDFSVIPLEDYNRVCGKNEKLNNQQLLFLTNEDYGDISAIEIGEQKYEVTSIIKDTVFTKGKNSDAYKKIFLVAQDIEAATKFVQIVHEGFISGGSYNIILNIKGSNENGLLFAKEAIDQGGHVLKNAYSYSNIFSDRIEGYGLFGSLLFIGAFFTILFLSATVLIIYFKQISEGYEDKERFEILQKVGMDDKEVKRTINKQILTVFFLPLVGALLHVSMATHMIIKLLEVLELYNVTLTFSCVIASSVIFTMIYVFVYRLTAKTYYQIVKW